ncbi:unnamed protein product [Prorocentrum cordatum]|uniref:Uncharacterized protein n=1 Tax=Prorocentrum cordatum TaxID=2364126 RepID=A0ABN9T1V0_9DINO|nr:unnamed protein product [Polarella glacialis]
MDGLRACGRQLVGKGHARVVADHEQLRLLRLASLAALPPAQPAASERFWKRPDAVGNLVSVFARARWRSAAVGLASTAACLKRKPHSTVMGIMLLAQLLQTTSLTAVGGEGARQLSSM